MTNLSTSDRNEVHAVTEQLRELGFIFADNTAGFGAGCYVPPPEVRAKGINAVKVRTDTPYPVQVFLAPVLWPEYGITSYCNQKFTYRESLNILKARCL